MGYYTYYQVSWVKHEDESIDEAIEKKFNDLTGIDETLFGSDYDVSVFRYIGTDDGWDAGYRYALYFNAKWYDWQDDIYELSKAYPDITFEVSGDGEGPEDLWKSVWKDGCYEIQYAIIPPFTGEIREYRKGSGNYLND